MKNQDFDRFVESTTTDDIVRHLQGLGLWNLADLFSELLEVRETLENYGLSDTYDIDEYLSNALEPDNVDEAITDFVDDIDANTARNGQVSRKKMDDIIKCHLGKFTTLYNEA